MTAYKFTITILVSYATRHEETKRNGISELIAKCQKPAKILSYSNSYDLNGIELFEELNTVPLILPKYKVCVRHYAIMHYAIYP